MNDGTVTRTHKGLQVTATYRVERKILTLNSEFGTKSTQIGGLPVEILAGHLLSEQIAASNTA